MVDVGELAQWALAAITGVMGWFLRELWSAVQKLKDDLAKLREDLPTSYVQKTDYKTDIGRVHELLDKIYEKLDGKADRH